MAGHSLTYLKVESVKDSDKDASSIVSKSQDKFIANENVKIEFDQHIKDEGTIFKIHDLEHGHSYSVVFSLKYYRPSTMDDQASGAYIFKPQPNDSQKKPYSKFMDAATFKAE